MGDDGKPTFRPNAAWFMTKIDFNNALKYKVIDRDVVKCGLDIELRMRFTGTFQQRFEVDDFPFDDQHITVSLGLNCRRNGPMPCDFALIDKTTLTIDPAGFGLRMQWKLDRNVFVHTDASAPTARPVQYLDTRVFNSQRQTSVDPSTRASAMTEGGPSGSFKKDKKAGSTTKLTKAAAAASSTGPRQFPAINFTVHVRRIPLYILAMVAFPASVMSFLSLLMCVRHHAHPYTSKLPLSTRAVSSPLTFLTPILTPSRIDGTRRYALPLQDAGDRIEASLTLVLTSFASKLSIKTLLPEASYSTLLDRFTFTCEIIVLASAVECGVLSCLALRVPDPYSQPDEVAPLTMSVEVTFFIVQASAIVLVHVYFIARFVCTVRRNRRDFDEFSSRKLNRDAEEISEKELESKKIVPLSVRRTERSPSGKNLASFVRPRAVVEGSGTALDGLNHEFREESYLDAVGPAMLKRNSSLGKSIKRVSRTLAGAQQTKRPVGWTSAGQTLRMRTSLSDQEKELTGKKEMSPRLKRESHESMTALAERASKHIQASSQLSVAQEPASGGDVKQPGPASSAATKSSHTAPTVLSRIPSYRSSPATAASAGGENDLWL